MDNIPKVTVAPDSHQEIELKGAHGSFQLLIGQKALLGAQRTDMGAPFSLTRPTSTRERISTMWLAYDTDSGFKYMVDRLSHYGANGYTFFSKRKKEVKFWEEWSNRVNEGMNTIIPGLREIIKWNMKHLTLGGLGFNNWLWGPMTIGKRTYTVPVKWQMHNQRSIVITRKGTGFSDEIVGVKAEKDWLTEGNPSWGEAYELTTAAEFGNTSQILTPKDKTSYFLLKLNTSQGDNTTDDSKPQAAEAAQSLYPTPPFFSLLSVLKERQQLRAMDLNIVDGFINKLVIWKIGDKDNPPLPEQKNASGVVTDEGTVAKVKNIITADNKGNVLQLYVPYWIDLDIKTPDINPLLSKDKYLQPWLEMLWAFGILVNPSASGDSFKDINTQNFEQMIDFYRTEHIEPFLENVLFREIARRNDLEIPEIRFNPLNTINNDFLQNIRELAGIGKVSTDTLLRFHRLDKKFELPIITDELDNGEEGQFDEMGEADIFNANTPIKFKQSVQSPDGEEIKTSSTAPGRPRNAKDTKKRKEKGEE